MLLAGPADLFRSRAASFAVVRVAITENIHRRCCGGEADSLHRSVRYRHADIALVEFRAVCGSRASTSSSS